MATIAPVIALAERRRVPQPPPDTSPALPPGASPTVRQAHSLGMSEGARKEREWWIEALGPWAARMWANAHPEMAGAVS